MIAKQTSIRDEIEDLLCPFTDIYVTQGSNEGNHLGTKAIDVRGLNSGIKYPYYAPCNCKCIKTYPSNGQSHWSSIKKVRLANGKIDYITFLIAHDNTFDAYVGQIISQGEQIGNLGDLGNATGVHCHIEIGIGNNLDLVQLDNKYKTWTFDVNKEIEFEEGFFMDNTNIIHGYGDWKYIKDVIVDMIESEDITTPTSSKSDENLDTDEKEKDGYSESGKKTNENSDFVLLKKIEKDGVYAISLYLGEELYIKK